MHDCPFILSCIYPALTSFLRPPLGWAEGVGFVERHDIVKYLVQPSKEENPLVVMCGPPVFEAAMRKNLLRLGFDRSQYYSYSEGDNVAAHL
jgi:Na+-transporting NADH:ubiquinone oxidoreductase subunit NqrF